KAKEKSYIFVCTHYIFVCTTLMTSQLNLNKTHSSIFNFHYIYIYIYIYTCMYHWINSKLLPWSI
ncbi:MAG: hypothetical protein N7Q72_01915, partial [Spiroplasma sp. Tabriz.8]|nr:hypothetical protein [Spiroplasma sp. Tabriz.8]